MVQIDHIAAAVERQDLALTDAGQLAAKGVTFEHETAVAHHLPVAQQIAVPPHGLRTVRPPPDSRDIVVIEPREALQFGNQRCKRIIARDESALRLIECCSSGLLFHMARID
ncbi:hypothetical protein [Sphingomonas sp. PAMC 26605]|uniref:hypothetical protein n=1 Tax=Sphingomonas sp. PAMC 26605 TaxID=1112214 RepID=UPI001E593D48|nr:hypothetical protein [Sphingomonas sp. PAMC 26605]